MEPTLLTGQYSLHYWLVYGASTTDWAMEPTLLTGQYSPHYWLGNTASITDWSMEPALLTGLWSPHYWLGYGAWLHISVYTSWFTQYRLEHDDKQKIGDNLHAMSNPFIGKKNRKNIISLLSAVFAKRLLMIDKARKFVKVHQSLQSNGIKYDFPISF